MSSIHETLAQLDDRLDDLRREVARLTEEPTARVDVRRVARGPGFSVARLPAGWAPALETPERPEVPDESEVSGAGMELEELLAACERLLGEARELMESQGAEEARPAFFEGMVTLVALGANRLQTIQVLEDSLSRAHNVTRVYVRRVHAGEVRLELTLMGGVDVVGELNRVMPFPFAVRSATREEIVISLEAGGVDL